MSDCYVAIKRCGCCAAAAVIEGFTAKENARHVAEWIRRGCRVEIKPAEWVRVNLRRCTCGPQQTGLPMEEGKS